LIHNGLAFQTDNNIFYPQRPKPNDETDGTGETDWIAVAGNCQDMQVRGGEDSYDDSDDS
jgi:hypothetical protein